MPACMISCSVGEVPSRGIGCRQCGVSDHPAAIVDSTSGSSGAYTLMSGSMYSTHSCCPSRCMRANGFTEVANSVTS